MKIAIAYPPISSPKGVPLLSQNRQFQWFNRPTFIYPVVPAYAATMAKAAGHAAANLARAVTGGDTRGPDDSSTLDEGDAATGRDGARPVGEAVVDGKTCRVSLLCTHMGGPLAWNEAEQSWDCPLHGSRFTPEGRVIEGPAVKDLPQLPKDE